MAIASAQLLQSPLLAAEPSFRAMNIFQDPVSIFRIVVACNEIVVPSKIFGLRKRGVWEVYPVR